MYISKRAGMHHTVYQQIYIVCLSFVSVYQMAPPLNEEVGDI